MLRILQLVRGQKFVSSKNNKWEQVCGQLSQRKIHYTGCKGLPVALFIFCTPQSAMIQVTIFTEC